MVKDQDKPNDDDHYEAEHLGVFQITPEFRRELINAPMPRVPAEDLLNTLPPAQEPSAAEKADNPPDKLAHQAVRLVKPEPPAPAEAPVVVKKEAEPPVVKKQPQPGQADTTVLIPRVLHKRHKEQQKKRNMAAMWIGGALFAGAVVWWIVASRSAKAPTLTDTSAVPTPEVPTHQAALPKPPNETPAAPTAAVASVPSLASGEPAPAVTQAKKTMSEVHSVPNRSGRSANAKPAVKKAAVKKRVPAKPPASSSALATSSQAGSAKPVQTAPPKPTASGDSLGIIYLPRPQSSP